MFCQSFKVILIISEDMLSNIKHLPQYCNSFLLFLISENCTALLNVKKLSSANIGFKDLLLNYPYSTPHNTNSFTFPNVYALFHRSTRNYSHYKSG